MIPCYQICKDRNCSHWNSELMDCERLPDDCEYSIEHLVSDREKQWLDWKRHGYWKRNDENGNVLIEGSYVNGQRDGLWRFYSGGKLSYEGCYVRGSYIGKWRWWHENGKLQSEGNYVDGELDGLWRNWDKNGECEIEEVYVNGRRIR